MILKILNKLLGFKWFPFALRIVTFLTFVVLVIIGFTATTDDPTLFNQLYKTNITTSLIWRLWWPMVVLSAIFLGRIWCIACPVEMITTFFSKIGFRKKRPQWILSGWVTTVFFIIILTLGITILQIEKNPKYTSVYLLIIMGVSVVTGLIYEKNTFCRYICPVGYLLGIFSKTAMWGWRVKKESTCHSCVDKSCVKSKYAYRLNNKSCGVDLIPADIDNNNYCLLCGGCLRTCKTDNSANNVLRPNPAIVEIGFANDLMKLQPILLAEWVLMFFVTGSMISELTHFKVVSAISSQLPTYSFSVFPLEVKSLIVVFVLYVFLPAILWILPYLFIWVSRLRLSLNSYIRTVSIIYIPVITFLYVGLIFLEVVKKFPYYKYILQDVKGVKTIERIISKQIEVPHMSYWTEWGFCVIQILALVIGIFFSFKVIRQLVQKVNMRSDAGILYVLPIVFSVVICFEAMIYQFFLNIINLS